MMRKIIFAFTLAVFALLPARSYASHALGAQITYEYVSTNGAGLQTYNIIYSFYRDCAGIAAPTSVTVDITSVNCGQTFTAILNPGCGPSGTQVNSGLCPAQVNNTTCNGGTLPGVELYTLCGQVTLPAACSDWVVSYSECCRNAAITNIPSASSYDLYVETKINNSTSSVQNSSPFFTTDPSQIFCAGHPYCYNHGAVDVDGDSLVFSLVTPLGAGGTPVPGYPASPMTTTAGGPFTFDPTTGQMCFTPDVAQVVVITVQVDEYRNVNGVMTKIGTTMRDIQFNILSGASCNTQVLSPPAPQNASGGTIVPPQGGALYPDSIVVCPNTPLSFTTSVTSTNSNTLDMTSNAAQSVPAGAFNINGSGTTTVTGTFTWTPGVADSGLHTVIVTVTDNACPFNSTSSQTIKIYVFRKPNVVASATAVCGDSIQLNATGGSSFTWTPITGLSCTNCPNPKAKPSVPTTYTAHTNCGDASISIAIGTPFTLDAGNDTAICLNGSAQLHATETGGVGPFTYSWTPTIPAGALSSYTILNPIAAPLATTTFMLHAVSSEGCVRDDSVKITLSGAAPRVTAYADPDTICPGGTVQLNLTVTPSYCGVPTGSGCGGSTSTFASGTGVTTTPTSSFAEPGVYGTYYGSRRVQMIYRASELAALGMVGGQINSMAFDVASIPAGAQSTLLSFSIKMKCTSDSVVSGSAFNNNSGMTQVYGPASTPIAVGWNVHTFTQPYVWDGSSNILVEICFNNAVVGTANINTRYSVTPFNSITDLKIDLIDACPQPTPNSTALNHRPNTRFNICQLGIAPGSTINWTPVGGLSNSSIVNPQAQVFNSTTYTGNVSINGCTGSGFVNVVVQKTLDVFANNDTSICVSDSILMHAFTVGAAQPILLNCGVNGTVCGGPNAQFTVGTSGTSTNTANPYLGADEEAHMQVLMLAAELKALGMKRGVIKDLSFNVANKTSSGQFQQFTIKMGCTNVSSLTNTFETGLATVFPAQNVTTSAGWNTYTFTSPYDWDGYSNLLVEVCFTNPAFAGTVGTDIVAATATSFYSCIDTSQSFYSQGGCNIASGARYQLRPDIRFNICPPPAGAFHYTWTLISGAVSSGTPAVLTGDSVKIKPTQNVSYQVQVTDSSCYAFDTINIIFLNGYSGNLVGKNIGCNGSNTGDIIATPPATAGPYSFTWKNSAGTILRTTTGQLADTLSNLAPGQYFVNMIANNNCQSKDSITLTVPSPLLVDSISVTNIGCFGDSTGSITAYISGGTPYNRPLKYNYLWSSSAADTLPTVSNLGAALYGLHIIDSSGCTLDTFAAVTQPARLVYDMDSTPVTCFGGHNGIATVNIISGGSGNFSFAWSNGENLQIDTGLVTGTYTVTITDVPGGCRYVDSVFVPQNDSFVILISAVEPASCWNSADGHAQASVGIDTTNYTFLWDNQEATAWATHLSPGIRRVVVTNMLGCPQFSYATITAPDRFSLTTQQIGKLLCYNDSNASARVIVDNSVGGVAPFRYWWTNQQNHDTVIQLKGDRTYYVTVTDANGCPEYDSIYITQPDSLHIGGGSINATCYNGKDGGVFVGVFGGTPPYFYDWSNGAQTDTVRNLPQGTYSVTVSDANNCRNAIYNIAVGQPATPVGLLSVNVVNVSCPGANDGGIFAEAKGGTPDYMFNLNNGTLQGNGYFNPLKPDSNYVLLITDSKGCKFDTTLIITEPDSFSISFIPPTDTIKLGDSILLQPNIQPYPKPSDRYVWSPAISLSCDTCLSVMAKPLITTVYEMTVSRGDSTNQCPQSARVQVVVINDKVLYVPNAFSPNDDGYNDFFQVYAVGGRAMKMTVYDRWGELMYSWDGDMTGKWDGTFNGEALPPAVFVYYIEVTYLDNQMRAAKGSVTIVK